jgi:hypothetical protein
VFTAAAEDSRVVAVIALAPQFDGGLRKRLARPGRGVTVPVLVQVADEDPAAQPAMKAAWDAQALVRHYPVDRSGVLPGGAFHDRALAHAIDFLKRSV